MPPDARAEVMKQIAEEVQQRKVKKKTESAKLRNHLYPGIVARWQQNELCYAD
jgi:hypothetical protein